MKKIVEFQAAIMSNYEGYVSLCQFDRDKPWGQGVKRVYLGKRENYDNAGHYDNSDDSLVYISDNLKMDSLLSGSGWVVSQQEMIDNGAFTVEDYAEFAALRNGLLKQFKETRVVKISLDIDKPGSGTPFRFPEWI